MRMQASIEFLLIAGAIAVLCLSVITLYGRQLFAETSAFGAAANALQANLSAPNGSAHYGAPQPSQLSASISQRNERLAYPLIQPAYVANILVKNHCTYFGFFGHPYDVEGQCGTKNAWDYLADWNCATSSAFCMYATDTGYSLASTDSARSYQYGFTLLLSTPLGTMHARMSSGANSSALMLGNASVGRASVAAVASTEPAASQALISNGTGYMPVNGSAYARYSQAQGALYPLLSYYNGSSIGSAMQAGIQVAIYSFIVSSANLRNSRPSPTGCETENMTYVCNATYPFLYVINVTVPGSLGTGNQTLGYLGSTIRVST